MARAGVRIVFVPRGNKERVPQDIRDLDQEIPWRSIAGMRDRLIHDYAGTDYDIVWNVAVHEVDE